jgi:hypothetical protein
MYIQTHEYPLPLYPQSQVHVKLPTVLSHLAFEEQVSIPEAHSSISIRSILGTALPEQDSCFVYKVIEPKLYVLCVCVFLSIKTV